MTDALSPIILNTIEQGVALKVGSVYWTTSVDPSTELEFGNSYLRSAWPKIEGIFQSELPSINQRNGTVGNITPGSFYRGNGFPFIVAPNGQTMAVDYQGKIVHSSNFGATWSAPYTLVRPSGGAPALNTNAGGIRGLVWHKDAFYMIYWQDSNKFELIKSTDGTTWSNVNTNISLSGITTDQEQVSQTILQSDGTNLYLVNNFLPNYNLRIFRSTNDGVSWSAQLQSNALITGVTGMAGQSIPYMDDEIIAYVGVNAQDYTSTTAASTITLLLSRDRGTTFTKYDVPRARTNSPMYCTTNIVRMGNSLLFSTYGGISGVNNRGQLNVFDLTTNTSISHSSGIDNNGAEFGTSITSPKSGSLAVLGGRVVYILPGGGISNTPATYYTFTNTSPNGLTADPSSVMFKANGSEFTWLQAQAASGYTYSNSTIASKCNSPTTPMDWKEYPNQLNIWSHGTKAYTVAYSVDTNSSAFYVSCHDLTYHSSRFITPFQSGSARPAEFHATASFPYNQKLNSGMTLVMRGK